MKWQMLNLKINIRTVFLFLLLLGMGHANADSLFVFKNEKVIGQISGLYYYQDAGSELSVDEVLKKDSFVLNQQSVTNLGISNSAVWIKLKIRNQSSQSNLLLGIAYPILDEVELYSLSENGVVSIGKLGDQLPYSQRIYDHQHFLFDILIPSNETRSYILRVKTWEQMVLPLFVGTPKVVMESNLTQDLIFGIFFGIMLGLVLYNLFIYFTVKDPSYLFYVTYIFLISLTQACLNGYTLRFLFPDNPAFANSSLILINSDRKSVV